MSDTLSRMALNDEGFMFDPHTGESFLINDTARFLLDGIKQGQDAEALAAGLSEHWAIPAEQASRDVTEFLQQLRLLRLIA
jgi:PqqD family protein of HPr-rel-A system